MRVIELIDYHVSVREILVHHRAGRPAQQNPACSYSIFAPEILIAFA